MQSSMHNPGNDTGAPQDTRITESTTNDAITTRNPIDSIVPGGVISLFLLFAVSVSVGLVILIERYQEAQYRDSLQRTAGENSRSISDFRLFYSREIVSRLKNSDIIITHDYKEQEHAIPLPATMSIEFGKFIEETGSGSAFRLYSDKPFPWRAHRQLDDYEIKALQYLQGNPGETYSSLESLNGKEYLRYASPVVMQESCVNCHNSHVDSPFRQWKVGDIRGVQEVLLESDRSMLLAGDSSKPFQSIIIFIVTTFGIALASILYLARRNRDAFADLEHLANLEKAERRAVSASMVRVKEGLARHAAVLTNASDGIITIDDTGRIETANPAAETIFGYTLDELKGRNIALLMPMQHAIRHDKYIRHYLETGESGIIGIGRELTGRRKHGEEFPMELSISEVVLGDRRLFTGIVRDITERKCSEEALRRSEEEARQLSMVASRTDNAVVLTDSEGKIEWINDGFTRISGYRLEEVVGRSPGSVLQGPDSNPVIVEKMSRAIRRKEGFKEEIINYSRDGRPYWISIEAQPILDEHGDVVQFMAIERDITDEKHRQQELEEARIKAEEASRAKSRFLAMMSHEIRTPLNGVIGTLGLLRDTVLDEEQKKYVETGRYSAENLLTIINDILSFSKLEAGKDELENTIFNLHGLIDSVREVLLSRTREKSITLHADTDIRIPRYLKGDAGKIRQVLLNLAGNAVKFTERGEVRIHASMLSLDDNGLRLRFMVSDTGIGISADDRQNLFDEFWTLSPAHHTTGTGLGLAICRNLVDIMSGSIDMESIVGKGSRFWFEIPLSLPTEDELEYSTAAENGDQQDDAGAIRLTGRILLAEDNPANQMIGVGMLSRHGLQVDTVGNGLEAVEAVRTRPYDLVLMDIAMPEMDGIEATHEIRRMGGKTASIPIIAMTAHVMKGDREKILAQGLDDYICKPVNAGELSACLQRWLLTGNRAIRADSAAMQGSGGSNRDSIEVLDQTVLEQLIEDTGLELAPALIDAFIGELDSRLGTILQASEACDVQNLAGESHALKSCAASYGAMRLSRLAASVEEAGREAAMDEAVRLSGDLVAAIKLTREAVTAYQGDLGKKL